MSCVPPYVQHLSEGVEGYLAGAPRRTRRPGEAAAAARGLASCASTLPPPTHPLHLMSSTLPRSNPTLTPPVPISTCSLRGGLGWCGGPAGAHRGARHRGEGLCEQRAAGQGPRRRARLAQLVLRVRAPTAPHLAAAQAPSARRERLTPSGLRGGAGQACVLSGCARLPPLPPQQEAARAHGARLAAPRGLLPGGLRAEKGGCARLHCGATTSGTRGELRRAPRGHSRTAPRNLTLTRPPRPFKGGRGEGDHDGEH